MCERFFIMHFTPTPYHLGLWSCLAHLAQWLTEFQPLKGQGLGPGPSKLLLPTSLSGGHSQGRIFANWTGPGTHDLLRALQLAACSSQRRSSFSTWPPSNRIAARPACTVSAVRLGREQSAGSVD